MFSWHTLRTVSVAILTAPVMLGGLMGQAAKAGVYGPLDPGQYGWVQLNLSPGSYHVQAWTFGDVDIALYNATGQVLYPVQPTEEGGYDNMYFNVDTNMTVQVRYSMEACLNPWGGCPVEINLYRTN